MEIYLQKFIYYRLLVHKLERRVYSYTIKETAVWWRLWKKKNENAKEIFPLIYPNCILTRDGCHVSLRHSTPTLFYLDPAFMALRQFLNIFVLPSFCMTLHHACPSLTMPGSLRRLIIQFQQYLYIRYIHMASGRYSIYDWHTSCKACPSITQLQQPIK